MALYPQSRSILLALTLCIALPATSARRPSSTRTTKASQRTRRLEQGPCGPGSASDPESLQYAIEKGKGGDMAAAETCLLAYIQERPEDVQALCLLSEVYARTQNFEKSSAVAEQALMVDPDSTESLFLKASALMAMHDYSTAREFFERALEIDPEHVNSMVNLGALLGHVNDHRTAVNVYRRALALAPDMWVAKHNYGTTLHSLKLFAQAKAVLQEVFDANPGCFDCAMSLANALKENRDNVRSKEMYEHALWLNPLSREAVLHLYTAMQEQVDWDDRDIMFERVLNATRSQLEEGKLPTVNPYYSLLSPFGAEIMLQIAIAHAQHAYDKVSSLLLDADLKRIELPAGKEATVRIAYIMADFRQHVTSHLIQTIFARHDGRRVAAHAIALNGDDGGSFRRRIRESVGNDRFLEMYGQSDAQVAAEINRRGIHVLIDIDYNKERLTIMAFRPAAVQVTWLAHPGTSGAKFVDYIVLDQVVAPPDHAEFVAEKMVYMKHHYQVNDHRICYPFEEMERKKLREQEGLEEDALVVANFNGLYKIEPESFHIWRECILRCKERGRRGGAGGERTPCNVQLWLVSEGEESNDNILKEAGPLLSPHIVFAQRREFDAHIRRAAAADLFLDSFTYNAHTTAVDALWGGIAVVTLPGETIVSRVGMGVLGGFGPGSESVTRTRGEYQELIGRLMEDRGMLQRLRERMMIGGRHGLESRWGGRGVGDGRGRQRGLEERANLMARQAVVRRGGLDERLRGMSAAHGGSVEGERCR